MTKQQTETVSSDFIFKSLSLKDDLIWKIKFTVKEVLDKTYRQYQLTLSYNDRFQVARIAQLEADIASIKGKNRLFSESEKEDVEAIKDQIDIIKDGIKEGQDRCPTLTFSGSVVEFKNNGNGETVLVLAIDHSAVVELDENKQNFSDYKVVMKNI